jgi:hypothetical protein
VGRGREAVLGTTGFRGSSRTHVKTDFRTFEMTSCAGVLFPIRYETLVVLEIKPIPSEHRGLIKPRISRGRKTPVSFRIFPYAVVGINAGVILEAVIKPINRQPQGYCVVRRLLEEKELDVLGMSHDLGFNPGESVMRNKFRSVVPIHVSRSRGPGERFATHMRCIADNMSHGNSFPLLIPISFTVIPALSLSFPRKWKSKKKKTWIPDQVRDDKTGAVQGSLEIATAAHGRGKPDIQRFFLSDSGK